MSKGIQIATVTVFLFLGVVDVQAQEVMLRSSIVSAGAGPSATTEHRLQSTVGPFGVGTLASTDHIAYGGFWAQVHPPAGPVALPALANDAVTTDEDVALTFSPLANDTDPGGGPLSITSVTQPDNGTVEQGTNDQLTYTPDSDFNGEDSFTYTATNDQGGSATATVTITVAPVNDAPSFTSEPVTGAAAGDAYTYVAEAADVDGDALALAAPTLPTWLAFSDNGDGTATLDGTPTNAEVGDHDVVLQASDGDVATEQAFTITVVVGAPSAPVLTAPADESTDISTDVTLAWNSVPGAATYELQFATVEDFSTTVIDTTGLTATSLEVTDLSGGTTYFWRVRAVNSAGASAYAGPFRFTTLTNVANEEHEVPDQFRLDQNYPNPFNPSTTVAFELPVSAEVRLVVYDVFGRAVKTLAHGSYAPGRHEVRFEAGNLASGHYFYRIEAGRFRATRQMLLIK